MIRFGFQLFTRLATASAFVSPLPKSPITAKRTGDSLGATVGVIDGSIGSIVFSRINGVSVVPGSGRNAVNDSTGSIGNNCLSGIETPSS